MNHRLFKKRCHLPVIYQVESAECGLACVAMIANYFGFSTNINSLRKSQAVSSAGATVQNVIDIARNLNLESRALKLEIEELSQLQLPAILHWDMDHFVVLRTVKRNTILIHDPATGLRRYSKKELGPHFTGIALELRPSKEFKKLNTAETQKITDLFSTSSSFYVCVLQIFLLSLLIQLMALATPFYVQLTVDHGLSKNDPDLLLVIALAFLILAIAKVAFTWLRGKVLIYFSNQIGFQMVSNVFHHLIRLPVGYFERRHIGDIVSRFDSTNSIKQLVTQEMITVVVDGMLSITTLIILYIYSPLLATLAVSFLSLFVIVRLTTIPFEKTRRQELLIADASQQSMFIENIRSILVTKIYCNEEHRTKLWESNYAQLVNSNVHLTQFQLSTSTFQMLIFGVDHVATIYFGSKLVFELQLSVGQLLAFIFLKQHFIGSVTAMIPKLVEIRLLRLQLERLADITLQEPEFSNLDQSTFWHSSSGDLSAHQLYYQYPGFSNYVIDNFNYDIHQGEFVVVSGPSGCGKSTLLKLLIGVISPSRGSILLEGQDIRELGLRNYRSELAAILHSDTLLAGSILSNIAMGEEIGDFKELETITKLTFIYDDIMRLPMTFNTVVGDMCASLSAGQIQRILLSRALYQKPTFLFLDEAMSNLGDELGKEIIYTLRKLKITVVMVTHNPIFISLADRQICMNSPTSLTTGKTTNVTLQST